MYNTNNMDLLSFVTMVPLCCLIHISRFSTKDVFYDIRNQVDHKIAWKLNGGFLSISSSFIG